MIKRYKTGSRMSQAVAAGGTLYLAGQVADDGRSSLEDQTRQVLAKIDALLEEAGSEKAKLLAVTVFLSNIADFAAMNGVYDAWVDRANPPTRACIEARLAPPGPSRRGDGGCVDLTPSAVSSAEPKAACLFPGATAVVPEPKSLDGPVQGQKRYQLPFGVARGCRRNLVLDRDMGRNPCRSCGVRR